jgi:selenocysteine lyase/cysteine desulfurase
VMGGSTTSLMFQLTQAILPSIAAGDEIIVTNSDHEANIGGWMRLKAAGAVVKIWDVNHQTLALDVADLDRLLSAKVKWVAITHASNVLGTINPVAQIAQRVHAVGARLCVDAVAYAPHRLVEPVVLMFMYSVSTKCLVRTMLCCGGSVISCCLCLA